MQLTLRRSIERDVTWIAELRADVLRDDLTRLGRYDPDRVRQRFVDAYAAEHTWVIVVEGEDCGSVAVRQEPDAVWIEHFYLPRSLQGKGIGGRVLDLILTQRRHTRPFRLNVLQGSPAQRLYERAGFLVDSEDDVDIFMSLPATADAVSGAAEPREN